MKWMLLAGLMSLSTAADAAIVNLAQGKAASADSIYAAEFGPEKAVDGINQAGNVGRFASASGATHFLEIDLGNLYNLQRIDIFHGRDSSYPMIDFEILYRKNSSEIYSRLYITTGNNQTFTSHPSAVQARYIKIINTKNVDSLMRLKEIEIIGDSTPVGNTNSAPVVNAGADISIAAPASSVTLSGSASDADGDSLSYQWTKVSGASAVISSPSSLATGISGLSTGNYIFRLTVSDGKGGITADDVSVSVSEASSGCGSGAGSVTREFYPNVPGILVSDIPQSGGQISSLPTLEAPSNIADNYGQRAKGHFCPPMTGDYFFEVAGDDQTLLQLSTDSSAANKATIAYVNGWTNIREFTKYSSQRSAGIRLIAGQKYYIEVQHKEANGGDNFAVKVILPNNVEHLPVPGSMLYPLAQNVPPVVNAGPDVNLTLPTNSLTAVGAASDANGDSLTYHWSKVSGGSAVISSPSALSTLISGLTEGSYTFRLTVNDGKGGVTSDDFNVNVIAASSGCGSGAGSVTREFYPNVPGILVSDIPQSGGQISSLPTLEAPSNIADNYGQRAKGHFCPPMTGDYIFEVAGDDQTLLQLSTDSSAANKATIAYVNGWTNIREFTKYSSQRSAGIHLIAGQKYYIEVQHKEANGGDNFAVKVILPNNVEHLPVPGSMLYPLAQNVPPVVNAGPDVNLTLPTNSLTAVGAASDANGDSLTYHWSKVSGGSAVISSPAALSTLISGLTEGSYTFRLTVNDGKGGVTSDDMSVQVLSGPPVNTPPQVNAGNDQSITLPLNTITVSGSASDADGDQMTYLWSKVSGNSATISNASALSTSISGLTQGSYIFRLTANDGNGGITSDEIIVTVNPSTSGSLDPNAGKVSLWARQGTTYPSYWDYDAAVFLPADYGSNPNKKYPMVLSLHGLGGTVMNSNHTAVGGNREGFIKQVWDTPLASSYQAIVIAPDVRPIGYTGNDKWWNWNLTKKVITDALIKYKIDPKRVVVTGLSAGGYGASQLAKNAPELLAGAMPGAFNDDEFQSTPCDLNRIPFWAFGNRSDGVFQPEGWESTVAAARSCTNSTPALKLNVYENGCGHGCWDSHWQTPEVQNWLMNQVKP